MAEIPAGKSVDWSKVGKKGFPRHFAALGLTPPLKDTQPSEPTDGQTQLK